jgi:hypothetical protein
MVPLPAAAAAVHAECAAAAAVDDACVTLLQRVR